MSDFPSILKSKISEKGLNAADAAGAIGVSAPSLRTALSGKSFPNARSLSKYSSFLGLSDADTKALIDAAKPTAGARAKKKAGKAGKSAGEKTPKSATSGQAKSKGGRKAKASSSASSALESIASALKQADGLMGDALAVAVHKLGAGPRKIIESIVKSLS